MDFLVRLLLAGVAYGVTALLATRLPRAVLTRSPIPVAVVAALAGAGAAFAPAAPTAVTAVDVVVRVALAAAVTAASARARRQAWLAASTAGVVAGVGAAYDWLAFVAVGVTLAMLVLGRRSWVVGAVIGACVSQVLLRLDLGPTTGTSAVVAGAVALLLLVSGLRRSQPSTRRWAWRGAAVLAGVGVVVSGLAALAAIGAQRDVRAGIDAGRDGLAAARRGDTVAAAGRFSQSADDFGRAGERLGRWWVRPGLAVPVVGHQLRAMRELSAAGEELVGAAAASSSQLDLKELRLRDGAVDLTALGRVTDAVGAARRALDRAADKVGSARSPWLVTPLVRAVHDLDIRMTEARRDVGTAAEVLDLAGPMLGRDGPRRWFLAVVTPAENRGSGGLIGNTGEVSATDGKLAMTNVERVARLTDAVDDDAAARVLPPIYAEAYGAWKVPAKLQNVTVTADFPTAAAALEAVLPLAGRGEFDGVISVDPLAVAALLEAVGPVSVPSWPVPITAGNAPSVLLYEQYATLAEEAREAFLGEVVAAVWERAAEGGAANAAALARALGPAIRGRHIQFHSRRAEEEAALRRLGAEGGLRYANGDHLGLVTDNGSQSKIDWFLRRAVDYRVHYDPGSGSTDATATVTLTNDAPASGLPDYILGGRIAPPGYSRQIVQLYTPLDLKDATVDGRSPPAASVRSLGRPGNWAYEFDVAVPPKSALTIVLHLTGRLPGRIGRPWTLDVAHQAAVRPDDVTVALDVPDAWRIGTVAGGLTGGGRTAAARLPLDRNARFEAEIARK